MGFAVCVEVAVGRRIQGCEIALERVGRELLDIDRDRPSEALRPERVPAHRPTGRVRALG